MLKDGTKIDLLFGRHNNLNTLLTEDRNKEIMKAVQQNQVVLTPHLAEFYCVSDKR